MDFKQFYRKYIPAPNSSGFFHSILLEYMKFYGVGDSILLVTEPKESCEVFKTYFGSNISVDIFPEKVVKNVVEINGNVTEVFQDDLNVIIDVQKKYDTVFCQAVLEHVCRPSICIENLVNMTNEGGIIVLMSHSPSFQYHAYPIDCVRFFRDFYVDLQKYLPINLLEYDEYDNAYNFVVYRKVRK